MKKTYSIESLSPMAQGISKQGKAISFIAKTLPDETVKAQVYKKKKQIEFAAVEEIIEPSPKRIEPECVHFKDCAACHYLHTSYEEELAFKKQALVSYMKPFSIKEDAIDVVSSPTRFHYRNRVQLHYRHQYLGFINPETDQVVEVPECKIIRSELQERFNALYQDKTAWTKNHQGRGHVELYLQADNNKVQESWNEAYASGGFSQVNAAINDLLCQQVKQQLTNIKPKLLIDCFAGMGNLSNSYADENELLRKMIDVSPENNHEDFLRINLYDDDALARFIQRSKIKKADCLLVDPPRKGFPQLNDWVNKLKVKHLLYVSCDPVTLVRDLKSLERKVNIESLTLLDMFPSSYHFESFAVVKLK
jgi:23S rRNA (uracil1939-C5)-methyltransferase